MKYSFYFNFPALRDIVNWQAMDNNAKVKPKKAVRWHQISNPHTFQQPQFIIMKASRVLVVIKIEEARQRNKMKEKENGKKKLLFNSFSYLPKA